MRTYEHHFVLYLRDKKRIILNKNSYTRVFIRGYIHGLKGSSCSRDFYKQPFIDGWLIGHDERRLTNLLKGKQR